MMLSRLSHLLRFRSRRPYRLLQIEPSLNCGLSCVMCPWTELRGRGGSMTTETFERIQPFFSQAMSVDFTGGGEPLVNPRLPEMVRAAKAGGCQVGFSTNGNNLAASLSAELLEAGLDWISFSVDAATPELYNRIRQGARFETVIDNIAALQDLKRARKTRFPRVMMVFVMMAGDKTGPAAVQNFQELPAFIELAQKLGVETVIAKNLDVILKPEDDARRLFRHTGNVSAEWSAALDDARQRAERLGISLRRYAVQPREQVICEHNPLESVFVNWEGWVSPCITLSYAEERYFAGERIQVPCQRFGNIHDSPLDAIWNTTEYAAFRAAFETRRSYDRRQSIEAALGAPPVAALPPAPQGCQSCYYLYGV